MRMKAVVLFASPASQDGKGFGPEMMARAESVSEYLLDHPEADLFIAGAASGFKPNELYSELVVKHLVKKGITESRIIVCGPSASTVAEIDEMEEVFRHKMPIYHEVYVAAGRYQVYRTRIIWYTRHHRKTLPLYLSTKGVPLSYMVARTLMEIPKLVLYFVLPKRLQDEANHRILGPRGL